MEQGACVSNKRPLKENGEARWLARATETQGEVEAGRKEKQQDHREYWEPPKEATPIQEAPRTVPVKL